MNTDRIKTISYTLYLIFLVIIVRLFYLQIINHNRLTKLVIQQTFKTNEIAPVRGKILDSYGNNIAYNQTKYQASLYKPNIKDLNSTINTLIANTPNIDTTSAKLLEKFSQNPNQKWLKLNYLYDHPLTEIKELSGITFESVNVRQYFNSEVYSSITGTVNYGGLEGYYQKLLSGRYGFSYQNQDAIGKKIISDKNWQLNPVAGTDIHTTINPLIQYQSFHILKNNLQKFQAKSGSIIIMEPQTGNIISMVSLDSSPSASQIVNKSITNLYEPGSIFKPLVMAAAFDSQAITQNWICTKCNQPRVIGEYSIENWDKKVHPDSTTADIIKNSDNIGMSYIIDRLGLESFLSYYQRLGFTRKTGIDLQGEAKPITKSYWPEIDLATASFGQGFAVTQIQMLSAFNTIANNGFFVEPRLVPYFEENGHIYPNKQPPAVSVFSPQTITNIKSILKYSVDNGVVSKFKPENLEVCAKSGTAQVAVKGGYSESATIASYIGFSPCQNPKFTMIVTIRNPKTSPWGSSTAAPIWYDLAAKITPLL